MAKEGPGSDRAELKKLLKLSGDEPVSMAFALGADGKAVVKLHKLKPPRSLEKGLKDDLDGAKNSRFGTVMLDPDDPKRVRFMVNKASGGIARKLVVALKGTGFSKVQIVTEDGETEEHEEEDEDAGSDDQDGAQPAADDQDGAQPMAAAPDAGPDATPDATPDAPPDAGALTADLTGLVRQMMAVIQNDPSRKAALAELATDAQASLKRGDLQQAAAGIEVFRMALNDQGGSASPGPGTDPADSDADQPNPASASSADAPSAQSADEPDPALGAKGQDGQTDPAASDPAAPAAGLDAATLTRTLSDLVKQLMPAVAADPTQRDTVRGLATSAQASLKQGDLQTAQQHVSGLQQLLQGMGLAPPDGTAAPPAAPQPGAPAPNTVAFVKARLAWLAARGKVESDVDKLRKEMASVYKNHGVLGHLDKFFNSKVEPILAKLDETLADKLDDVATNTNPAQHAQFVDAAKRVLDEYKAYVEAETFIGELDENPFVPLQIRKTLTSTLTVLEKVMA